MPAKRIMVVEDEPIVALDLEHTLQRLDYEVVSCVDTGEEAVRLTKELHPDLVLMDINLAGEMDGIEAADRIWTDYQTPVIYLTAYSTQEIIERATVTGPFGYLIKPFHANSLKTSIEVALYKDEMEKALRRAHDELEQRVQERTAELLATNQSLQTEIAERQRVETELLLAKEEAEAASRIKSEFLATMSHELRTPLNIIIGYNEIMLEEACEREENDCIDYLEKVKASAQQLLTLVNDVLDFTKIEADQLALDLEPLSLVDFINGLATSVRPLLEANDNSLEVHRSSDLGIFMSDPRRLRQCLLNLLSNAAKFTEHGQVWLEAERLPGETEERLEFRVRDTGIGISPEHLATLFDAFTQVDGSSTRKYGGTGLGLAITARLCRMMNGDISVVSELGEGSTFTICLPAVALS